MFEVSANLEVTECCACGTLFAVSALLLKTKRNDGGFIHCPNGHSIGWGKGKIEKKLEMVEQDLAGYKTRNASLSSEVSSLEASNRGLKAANTRLKNKKGK